MPIAKVNGIELCYEVLGDTAGPVVLLIAGHGAQLVWWDQHLVDRITALGACVVRFDNRDVGLSTHLHHAAVPDPWAIAAGDRSTIPYEIDDMADDAAGLLGAIGVERAHVVGISLGGMIAQSLAIRHPGCVASLTSLMSSPDPLHVGTPRAEVLERWMREPAQSLEEEIDRALESSRLEGSPQLGLDEHWLRSMRAASHARDVDPLGVARQLAAIVGSADRRPGLAGVRVPTFVMHGEDDPVITPEGGEATAAAVPGARLELVAKMGHDLPAAVWPVLLDGLREVSRL